MMNQQEAKRSGCRTGCLWMLAIIGGLGLTVVAALAWFLLSANDGGLPDGGLSGMTGWRTARTEWGVDERPNLVEVWSSGSGEAKVARILVRGLILFDTPGFFSEGGSASAALRAIRSATVDPDVRGIILDVDSGGGGITASDILYQALLDFKRKGEGRVVVAQFGDVAASGAYYIALAADKIVAHPTTLTGSIGVIMQSYNIRDLAAKLGITDVTIKSGANKDLLNPFGELTPEQRTMLQGVVDALHDRFVTLTAERRNLDEPAVRAIADGRVFLAPEALKHGLIDQVGYAEDVDALAASLLRTNAVRVIRYEEPSGLFDLFLRKPGVGFNLQNLQKLIEAGEPRLMYK
jgi:protease-4